MEEWRSNPHIKLLTDSEVPKLLKNQLDMFTLASIHSHKVQRFDSAAAVETLRTREDVKVVAADFGGDKGISRLFQVQNGVLVQIEGYRDDIQGNDGQGYVASLKKTARYAEENDLPFGISWGGPMEGSKVLFHPKATVFMSDLKAEFGSDLSNISPTLKACLNDALAGLVGGAVEAYRKYKATSVIFAINGGGFGLSALVNNTIYATEAGHVEGVKELNTYDQSTPCGVFDATYICIERLGANKAGIEAQWQAINGQYMRARDIEDRYKEGNQLAAELYEHSAYVTAHMIKGAVLAFDINVLDPLTAIVCHGGAFKFPEYGERVAQIVSQDSTKSINLVMTKNYETKNSNACLDGAAIAAITALSA
jgi:predicted NBD/HSP70 family sugar kinase